MRKTIFLLAAAALLTLGVAQAEPPKAQQPSMARPPQSGPAQARPDHNRFKQAQKPQALGRQGQVSDEDEEEEEYAQSRPNPMRNQTGQQAAPMRTPAAGAVQTQGR